MGPNWYQKGLKNGYKMFPHPPKTLVDTPKKMNK